MSIAIDFQNVFCYLSDADNFSVLVFRLIAKADAENMEKLRLGFPTHVALYEWWMALGTQRPLLSMICEKVEELEARRDARS